MNGEESERKKERRKKKTTRENRAFFTEEETGALNEKNEKRKKRLNKDTAKSETVSNISTRRKKILLDEAVERRLTWDINFSLKLAPRLTERKRPKTVSPRNGTERRVGTQWRRLLGKKRQRRATGRTDGGRRRSEKEGGSGRKVPWRETRCASPWQSTVDGGSSPWWRERRSPFSRRGSNYGERSDSHLRALYHRPS